jgi:hypothetical protein
MGKKLDEMKENLREAFTGSTPQNDLRARLHADHTAVSRRIDDLLATDDDEIALREGARHDLTTQLRVHATAEEGVVYTAIRLQDVMRNAVDDAINEHEDIERCLVALSAIDCGHPEFLDRVRDLQQAVVHHVHEEENNFLPMAERTLGQEYLAGLIPQFEARKSQLMAKARRAAATDPVTRGLDDAPSQF